MSCRIAESPETAQPVIWRGVGDAGGIAIAPQRTKATEESAQLQARVTSLESKLQTDVAKAREDGLKEGHAKATADANAQVQPLMEKLARTLADLAPVRAKLRNQSESDVVRLALAIAKRILHREISLDPDAIEALVRTALEKLEKREISRVRVCPAQANTLRTCLERLGATPAIQIVPDTSLCNGDLVFETALGELEASVDSQLREIERGFADRLVA